MVAGQGYQPQKRKFEEEEDDYKISEEGLAFRKRIFQLEKELVEKGLLHKGGLCLCLDCRKVKSKYGLGSRKFRISAAINKRQSQRQSSEKWASLDLDKFERDSAKRREERQIDLGAKFIINIVDICPFSTFN
jgi:hypothetical protein